MAGATCPQPHCHPLPATCGLQSWCCSPNPGFPSSAKFGDPDMIFLVWCTHPYSLKSCTRPAAGGQKQQRGRGSALCRAEPCSHPAPVLLPGTSEIRKHRWHFAPDEQHTVDRAEAPTPQVAAAPSLRPADTKQRVAEKEGEHRGLAKGMCLCPVLALPRCRAAGSDATIRWQCVGCARGQTGTPRGVLAGQALHSRALPGD